MPVADCPGEFVSRIIGGFGNEARLIEYSGLVEFYDRKMPTAVWTGSQCPTTEEQKKDWFYSLDLNGDSLVDQDELNAWVQYLCANSVAR